MLHGQSLQKNRRYFCRYCKICWNEIGSIKLLIRRIITSRKNKKRNWNNERKLGGRIMVEIASLRPKTYSFLRDDDEEKKIAKKVFQETKN